MKGTYISPLTQFKETQWKLKIPNTKIGSLTQEPTRIAIAPEPYPLDKYLNIKQTSRPKVKRAKTETPNPSSFVVKPRIAVKSLFHSSLEGLIALTCVPFCIRFSFINSSVTVRARNCWRPKIPYDPIIAQHL